MKNEGEMKHIEVVAAIIQRDGAYFSTQRGYGEFEGMWEFSGGKIEPGEGGGGGGKREIQEELGVDIVIENLLCTTEYDYPSFHLKMHCYLCRVGAGEIELREHKSALWLRPEELESVEWLPADKDVISRLQSL